MKRQGGRVVRCKRCGLTLDRQLCGAVNIYLRMCGFPPSPSTFYRSVSRPLMRSTKRRRGAVVKRGRGVTAKEGEANDLLSMKPEGAKANEPQSGRTTINVYVR